MSQNEEIDRGKLNQFIANIEQEILNMQAGEGTHRPGALHFDKGPESSPVMHSFAVFKEFPSQKNLDAFLELAVQDFGTPTGSFFKGQSTAIFKVDPETVKPTVKAFDVSIKDGFYDMFRAASIALSPKQVERIETIALQLAQTFEQQVSDTVGTQLEALVKKLKVKEEEKRVERKEDLDAAVVEQKALKAVVPKANKADKD